MSRAEILLLALMGAVLVLGLIRAGETPRPAATNPIFRGM